MPKSKSNASCQIRPLWHREIVSLVFLFVWIGWFSFFWLNVIRLTPTGLFVRHLGIWGDWAAHFTIGSTFAYRQEIPAISPFIYGQPFHYPWLADALSGFFIWLGIPFWTAFIVPSWLASILTVIALMIWYRLVFKSSTISVISTAVFLLNGGVGWWWLIKDAIASHSLQTVISHSVTNWPEQGFYWSNIIDSMLIPQRAFTLGFPIALIILSAGYYVIHRSRQPLAHQLMVLFLLGLMLGGLAILHTHSYLSLMAIICWWGVGTITTKNRIDALRFMILIGVGAVVGLWGLTTINIFQPSSSPQWMPGWYAHQIHQNWLWFWVKNWGGVPVISGIGLVFLVLKSKNHSQQIVKLWFHTPFFILFLATQLWSFQPYVWDNTKFIVWASLGFSGLFGWLLVTGWTTTRQLGPWSKTVLRAAIILLMIVHISAGSLDLIRITQQQPYLLYSHEELELAEWVKSHTQVTGTWLTPTAHNNWLFNLTGRQALLTYEGWLWSHGYDYQAIKKDWSSLYTQPDAKLLKQYDIKYAVVNPNQISTLADWTVRHQSASYLILEPPTDLRE